MTTQTDLEREQYEAAWAALGVKAPPRGVDLPYSDGEPMESFIHWLQMSLLIASLKHNWRDRNDYFIGGNMFLYYSAEQARTRDIRGPDVFVALDVPGHSRQSWVIWEENKPPDLIFEINSPSTRHIDHGIKKRIYQDQVRAPMYVIYDMDRDELEGHLLVGREYQPVPLDAQGRLLCRDLNLYLVRWVGPFLGDNRRWLRWATLDGQVLSTSEEDALAAHAEADAARTEADAARAELQTTATELDAERHRREAAERRIRELEARLSAQDTPTDQTPT